MEHRDRQALQKIGRIGRSPLDLADVPLPAAEHRTQKAETVVVSDLPASLPVVNEEVGLLRAFLSAEINAILRGEDQG